MAELRSVALSASLLALLSAVCRAQVTTEPTQFLPCAEKNDPISVRVPGCAVMPCKLQKGKIAGMEVDFEVDQDVERLDVAVTAFALGATIDYPLKQKNTCLSLTNAECPLDKYERVTYKLALPVDQSYPSISLAIEIALKDKNKRSMTCFKLTLQVVDAD